MLTSGLTSTEASHGVIHWATLLGRDPSLLFPLLLHCECSFNPPGLISAMDTVALPGWAIILSHSCVQYYLTLHPGKAKNQQLDVEMLAQGGMEEK